MMISIHDQSVAAKSCRQYKQRALRQVKIRQQRVDRMKLISRRYRQIGDVFTRLKLSRAPVRAFQRAGCRGTDGDDAAAFGLGLIQHHGRLFADTV